MTDTRALALAAALAVVAACGALTFVYALGIVSTRAHAIGPGLLCLAPLLAAGAAFALVLALARRHAHR